jgi:uncharacterized OB-fold protein
VTDARSGTPAGPPPGERPPKPRPAPTADHDSAPYWQGLHDGKLLVQRCQDCGEVQLYPRDRCLECRGPVAWVEASGRGRVYSFTVIRQNYARPFRDWIPYVVALVDLEEGPRLMTDLVDCEPDDVQVGMAVEARFEVVSDDAGIALFAPAH